MALTSLRISGMGSIEDQLRASDSLFLTSADQVASLGWARTLSAFLPGAGHIVLGRNLAGFIFLGFWIGFVIWAITQGADLKALIHMKAGQSTFFLIPVFGAGITWVVAFASLGGGAVPRPAKGTIDRPRPPVDLPFE
jgi:hypothetical protein